nr:MAG TPA: hypothetical protein [Caudoviricetes sp.]
MTAWSKRFVEADTQLPCQALPGVPLPQVRRAFCFGSRLCLLFLDDLADGSFHLFTDAARLALAVQDHRAIALRPSQTFCKPVQRDFVVVHSANQSSGPRFRHSYTSLFLVNKLTAAHRFAILFKAPS